MSYITDDLDTIPRDVRGSATAGGVYHTGTGKVYIYTKSTTWYDTLHPAVNHELTHAVTYPVTEAKQVDIKALEGLKSHIDEAIYALKGQHDDLIDRLFRALNSFPHELLAVITAEQQVRDYLHSLDTPIIDTVDAVVDSIFDGEFKNVPTQRRNEPDVPRNNTGTVQQSREENSREVGGEISTESQRDNRRESATQVSEDVVKDKPQVQASSEPTQS
ncbi:MAG: hypothetical protein Q4G13_03225 [Moraxella sp.]|nr:hypothetical protein [Moraxella sp.]